SNPRDARRYINYNGNRHFNLRNLRVYWEHSASSDSSIFGDVTRRWNTDYLGKRLEQLEVRYPSNDGVYRNGGGDDDD
ncbi:hypothetical protein, partial [Streptococcus pneumoniae]|uniref:hypothetical protein n=1 Tax=Streptococcus pneumoniae TaxID=1313 RepID=UPI0018B0ACEF